MIFISEKEINSNLKKYKFKSVKGDFKKLINDIVFNFIYNVTKKASKSKKELTLSHFKQLGGRVVLPSEYFGIPSNHYVSSSQATDMSVTQDYIRPEMMTYRPGLTGGKNENEVTFKFTIKSLKPILSEVLVKLDSAQKLKKTELEKVAKAFKGKLEEHFSKMFKDLKKMSDAADVEVFKSKFLSMKKYAHYGKMA